MNDAEKRMMSEEYGKDFNGCLCVAFIVAAVVIVVAIAILFT